MRGPSWQSRRLESNEEPEVVYTDDGGSGLLEACRARFAPPDFEVECDVRHTVWVKRADGTRSFGLAPWLLIRYSVDEVLIGVEKRLGVPL